VRMTSQPGDSCPVSPNTKARAKVKPLPLRHQ
jgi:hypothetical protein